MGVSVFGDCPPGRTAGLLSLARRLLVMTLDVPPCGAAFLLAEAQLVGPLMPSDSAKSEAWIAATLADRKSLAARGDFEPTINTAASIGSWLANSLMVAATYFLKGFHIALSAGLDAGESGSCDCGIATNTPLACDGVFREIL